MPEEVRLTL